MKRFIVTGKGVFVDTLEKIAYVELNSGMVITSELNPETMATLAWSQASPEHRKQFILQNYNETEAEAWCDDDWMNLPQYIKDSATAYQKSKLEVVPQ